MVRMKNNVHNIGDLLMGQSLLDKLKKQKQQSSGFMAAIGGARLSGKSTLAGTLPGSTLVIQPAGIEAGNTSPMELAKKLGNKLDLIEVENHGQLFEVLQDTGLLKYDNIYVDGISAFTEMVYSSPEFATKTAKNKWDGFDYIKDQSGQLVLACKELAEKHDKNVFITYSLKEKTDENGNVASVEMDAKGNATKTIVEGRSPNVVAAVAVTKEDGSLVRGLITKNKGPYVARLGNLLDEDNPGKIIPADLSTLLTIIGRA